MCNDGREAAYLATQFGSHIVGVDFSDAAISYAETLDRALGAGNEFVVNDVMSYLRVPPSGPGFDKIILTLGSLRWLSDLPNFFRLLPAHLRAGGEVVLWDFHPLLVALDDTLCLVHDYPFTTRTYQRSYGVIDYVSDKHAYTLVARRRINDDSPYNNQYAVTFSEHSFGAIFDAASGSGSFMLASLAEYDFSWEEQCLSCLRNEATPRYVMPQHKPRIPLTFVMRFVTTSCDLHHRAVEPSAHG